MTKARIEYLLSEEGRKASLLAGGDGKELQAIETEATPEIIRLARVDRQGNIILPVGFRWGFDGRGIIPVPVDVKVLPSFGAPGYYISEDTKVVYFDEPQTVEALVAWERQRVTYLATRQQEIEREKNRLAAEYEEKAKKEAAERAVREEEERKRREAEAAEREAREKEKAAWIEEHGSDYLKRAFRLGYDCQRQYVTERAAAELPGFTVDFDYRAAWRSRSCPSEDALAEVERLIAAGYDAKCVWLTAPAYEPEEWEEFEPHEAIVIENYLGKYYLVREL